MQNKNITKGNMFSEKISGELLVYVQNVHSIINEISNNSILNSKIVGQLTNTNITIRINYKNIKEIINKHGNLDINGLVLTINKPDRIISSKGKSGKEILNFIKFSIKGFQLASAIRINGFAVITHFERCIGDHQTTRRTQQYLNSLLNRGMLFYSSGKTADLPLITDFDQHLPSEP